MMLSDAPPRSSARSISVSVSVPSAGLDSELVVRVKLVSAFASTWSVPVPTGELPDPVANRRRARLHRVVGQIPLDVRGQGGRRLVPPVSVLLQRPHHHPVQLTAEHSAQPPRVGRPARRDRRADGVEDEGGSVGEPGRVRHRPHYTLCRILLDIGAPE